MTDLHLLRVFLSLLAVIALLLATVWLLRRLPGVRHLYGRGLASAGHRQGKRLTLLHTQPLGSPRMQLALVRVDREELLLGITPGQITLLHTLARAEHPAATSSTAHAQHSVTSPETMANTAPAPHKFASLLAQLMKGKAPKGNVTP